MTFILFSVEGKKQSEPTRNQTGGKVSAAEFLFAVIAAHTAEIITV